MRSTLKLFVLFAFAVMVMLTGLLSPAVAFSVPTPERVVELFNLNFIIIAFAWGLLCKYLPVLKAIPNATIPWVSALVAILSKLGAVSAAHASGIGGVVAVVPDAIAVLVGGFTNAIWARQLYEAFARPFIERKLKLKTA